MKITKTYLKNLISEEYQKLVSEKYSYTDSYAMHQWISRIAEFIKQRVEVEEVSDAAQIREEMIRAVNQFMDQVTSSNGKIDVSKL